MSPIFLFRSFALFFSFLWMQPLVSQNAYQFSLRTSKAICLKGDALLEIGGTDPADSVSILWSTGQGNIKHVNELNAGDYSVFIKIKHKKDTLTIVKDTTFYFVIEKELCGVNIDKYFSPNDDNYHDYLSISNTVYYPNFELNIFNKWGQQVHHQKNEYKPWDGKWNGIDLPDGTYFYVFFFDSAQKTNVIKGDITILR